MPILDVEVVVAADAAPPEAGLTQVLADAAGRVLEAAPGSTWLRLRTLPDSQYAENGAALAPEDWPVFVTVLHAHLPQGAALDAQARALTEALAAVLGRSPQRVHVEYAAAGAGRQAFGGVLVR